MDNLLSKEIRVKPNGLNIDCYECPSHHCSLLKYCLPENIDLINNRKRCMSVKKGQQVLYERTLVDKIFFIQTGKVKVYKTGINGKQQIIRLSKTGDILGHRGLNRKLYPISAIALSDTILCGLEVNDFVNVLQTNPNLAYHLMMFYADELYYSEIKTRNLAQFSVREKVADALLNIQESFKMSNECESLGVILSRQEIAEIAGTTKEQVSKNLADFKDEGIIQLNGKEILILDCERLKGIVGISE
ncbi:MAG: Crp/Fnr family transcriptional regulator [Cyclobacteriaceae bacterium]|nr:Crp/Fnr family transcriptional regulator [Cyclobacteriaceae bacterium]